MKLAPRRMMESFIDDCAQAFAIQHLECERFAIDSMVVDAICEQFSARKDRHYFFDFYRESKVKYYGDPNKVANNQG